MRFITDWRECYSVSRDLLSDPNALLLSRIGGSDTNAVVAYLTARQSDNWQESSKLASHRQIVQRFNGYYDNDHSFDRFIQYLDELISCYLDAPHLFFCNFQLLSMYFPTNIDKAFFKPEFDGRHGFEVLIDLIRTSGRADACFPYPFVERLAAHRLTLFNVLSETLAGKKVLVVSPFSESILLNFANRHRFFKNYSYPEFSLEVCNTPITYAGLPPEFYPHHDWFETTEFLKRDIAQQEFDVALLSCGSYAMPLGRYITNELKRTAIYVGGVLQLYFGVMGRRYADSKFFTDQINSENFIFPVEGARFLEHVSIGTSAAKEAFGAYF